MRSRYVFFIALVALVAGCKTVQPVSTGKGWWELDLKKAYGADDIRIKMADGKISPDFDGKVYFHKK